jgi:hypothetical protein
MRLQKSQEPVLVSYLPHLIRLIVWARYLYRLYEYGRFLAEVGLV